jgi:hypothetical protein
LTPVSGGEFGAEQTGVGGFRMQAFVRRHRLPLIVPGAMQAVVPRRSQPIWQHRERLLARPAPATPHPNALVLLIVSRTKPLSVADDRGVLAQRNKDRAAFSAGLPRLTVVFGLSQCDKENHGWRERPGR